MTTLEPAVTFERLARAPEASATRRRIELATLWCAAAGLAGAAPACALYVSDHLEAMPGSGWTRLIIQVVTFVVLGGAFCGLMVGAGLSVGPGRHAAESVGNVGSAGHHHVRVAAVVVLGSAAAAGVGSLGASHFGSLTLPYFGGPAIFTSLALAATLAAAGFARTESVLLCSPLPWWKCVGCALTPAPLFGSVVVMAMFIEPSVASLHLDAMRELANHLGLALVGGAGGAIIGMLGAAWFASSALLGERLSATRSESPPPSNTGPSQSLLR